MTATLLSVVALTEHFWIQRSKVYLPCKREEVQLTSADFDEVIALFLPAHAGFDSQRPYICIDGMGLESCLVSSSGTRRLRTHVSAQTRQLVKRLIDLAWNSCRDPWVRNALAHAGRYIDVEYPLQPLPPQPEVTHLAVLGTPEERREYLQMLQQSKKRKYDSAVS